MAGLGILTTIFSFLFGALWLVFPVLWIKISCISCLIIQAICLFYFDKKNVDFY